MILPGMLCLQAIHAFLQLFCRLLQLETAPMQLVADLQHAMDAARSPQRERSQFTGHDELTKLLERAFSSLSMLCCMTSL